MAPPPAPRLDILVFAGQGITATNSSGTYRQVLHDAASPAGSLILSACHEAFHTELSSLSSRELEDTDVDMNEFETPDALLSIPTERHRHNPIISGARLLLIQSLRYLAFSEASGAPTGSASPFSDILKRSEDHSLAIVGFSSGILPTCVVGTSLSTISYITHTVEAFRLVLWIGIRAQIHRRVVLFMKGGSSNFESPWSLVFHGLNRNSAKEAIEAFHRESNGTGTDTPSLYITAVTDDTCVTISGRPDTLFAFSKSVQARCTVHNTTLDTLYHAPVLAAVREDVLEDVLRRNIRFPDFTDIKIPIRSTHTGEILDHRLSSGSLVESVVDMLLIQPVNWDLVVNSLVKSTAPNSSVRLINYGPGMGITRSVENKFPRGQVSSTDAAVNDTNSKLSGQESIAIIGMALNMPGAPNVSKFWDVLEQGINTISEIPEHRFKVSAYNNPKNGKTGRTMKAYTGNFVDDVDDFDYKFFRISPREAKSMDPQQRILLHVAYEALEHAGYVPNSTPSFQQSTFGCYIGAATHDYVQNLRENIDVYYSTGTLKAFLSGRISYAMQLSGPSVVLDTACSSSTVAIYQACRALMNHDCNAALAGGVNVITSPDMFLGLDRGHFLSPTGQCKAFDASADGYSRGEGCGIFVLKRLSDAISENDNIMGVIRGIEVNQSGLAQSITHPHGPTQAALFKKLLEKSGIDPRRVNVVEAHGTGTAAGDPNELQSVRSIFAVKRNAANPLYITSVKANIGHLEAASGSAGLAKLLLMLKHRTIPRQISLRKLNPQITPLESDYTVINTKQVTWAPSSPHKPRIALLNNFGAAGSNAALLLEEFFPSSATSQSHEMPYVFGLSAKTDTALQGLRHRYLGWLQSSDDDCARLGDIAYTATARRQIYPYRMAVSARNKAELIDKLNSAPIMQAAATPGQVVFVFSGQGCQYFGMGRSLYQTSTVFKGYIDECHAILTQAGFPGVLQIIVTDANETSLTEIEEFEAYHVAMFSLEYALARLWMSWGLVPVAVIGHSLGEYAALVTAGVLTLNGALSIVANRVRLMAQKCSMESTGMLALKLGASTLRDELRRSEMFSEISIACYNSAVDTVISGPLEKLKAFKAHVDNSIHCKNTLLAVPLGFHSVAMSPILADLELIAESVSIHPPTIPVVSNVFGSVVMAGDDSVFDSHYFSRHCAEPVQFDWGVQALAATFANIDTWIEIGPHTTCLPMLRSNIMVSKDALLLGSLRKQQDAWTTLTTSLSRLYSPNAVVNWREVFSHLPSVSCVALPSYPFSTSKFWVPFVETHAGTVSDSAPTDLVSKYSMVHTWVQYPCSANGFVAIFETPISILANSIQGHMVGGMPLCPASVYIEQILASIDLVRHHLELAFDDSHVVIRRMEFAKPLVYNPDVPCIVTTTVTLTGGSGVFNISSQPESLHDQSVHVHGEFHFQSSRHTILEFSQMLPVLSRKMSVVVDPERGQPEVFSTRTAYEVIFPRVVDYGKEYHTMQSLTVDPSGMECYARVKLPSDYHKGKYVVHPVFMDTLLHVAGFVANMRGGVNDAYICSEVGSVKVFPKLVDNDGSYSVFCSLAWLPDEGIMLAEAYAVGVGGSKQIVAHIRDMHFRRVQLNSLKRGLARAAGVSPIYNKTMAPRKLSDSIPPMDVTLHDFPRDVGDVQIGILDLVSETCDISPSAIDIHADLASLGVDSLMSIEIFQKLETTFPQMDLNAATLSSCRSVFEMAREVSARCLFTSSKSQQASSGRSSPRTLVQEEKLPSISALSLDDEPDVKRVLASVLDIGLQEIGDDTELVSLGLDSLTSIEALHAFKSEFGIDFPGNIFTTCPTARSIQSYLSSLLKSNNTSIANTLRLATLPVPLQMPTVTGRTPLFVIHDGSGLINYYDRLLPLARRVWGIHNPRFITSQPWDGVASMAASYAEYVYNTVSEPVILGGWSFGGVVAFEVARQLLKKGVIVRGVILIDSPSPVNHVPLSCSLLDSIVNLDARSKSSEIGRLVKSQFEMNSRMLGEYDPLATDAPYPRLALLRSREGYHPPDISKIPTWLTDRSDAKHAAAGWESLVGTSVEVLDIPGHHFEPFHASNIAQVSHRIAEACEYFEGLCFPLS